MMQGVHKDQLRKSADPLLAQIYRCIKRKNDITRCVTTCYVVISCGGRTRTCDLQVMSLASYQLLHSAILTMFQKHFSELRVQSYGLSGEYANVVG